MVLQASFPNLAGKNEILKLACIIQYLYSNFAIVCFRQLKNNESLANSENYKSITSLAS